jgi:hypothetical protein
MIMRDFHYWLVGYGPTFWISIFVVWLALAIFFAIYGRR